MGVIILQIGAICGALITIWGLAEKVIRPFKNAIDENKKAMQSLQDTIKQFSFEMRASQKDRDGIHETLNVHERRINNAEDAIIAHKEQIKTLFNKEKYHEN